MVATLRDELAGTKFVAARCVEPQNPAEDHPVAQPNSFRLTGCAGCQDDPAQIIPFRHMINARRRTIAHEPGRIEHDRLGGRI